jgi:hypothetical protein
MISNCCSAVSRGAAGATFRPALPANPPALPMFDQARQKSASLNLTFAAFSKRFFRREKSSV